MRPQGHGSTLIRRCRGRGAGAPSVRRDGAVKYAAVGDAALRLAATMRKASKRPEKPCCARGSVLCLLATCS